MVDTYNQIRRRKKLYVYSLLFLFLSVAVLAIPAYSIYSRSKLAVENDYDRRLYRADYDPVVFLAKCYTTRVCPDALKTYLTKTPLIPLSWWGYLSLGLFGVAFSAAAASRIVRDEREPGVAHWATKSELKEKGYFNGNGYLGVAHGKKLAYPGDSLFATTLVLGNPGSGKTRNVLEPQIVEAVKQGMSVVVFDQKYPNVNGFPKYFEWIERETDAKIEVFLPNEPNSPTLPLLEIAKTRRGAGVLTRVFYPEVDPKSPLAHHFARERPLLELVFHLEAKYGEGAVANVIKAFSSGYAYFVNYINEAYGRQQIPKDEYQRLQSFFELSNAMKSETLAAIKGRLGPLENEVVQTSFRFSSRNASLYEISKRQTVFYVALDQAELGSGATQGALQAIQRAIIFALLEDAKANAGSVTVPTLIFFDEFPFLGYMPGLSGDLNTLRERRVGYVMAAQNLASIAAAYEDHLKEYEAVIESVGHYILTHKTSPGDVIKLAEHIGKTSARKRSESTSSDILGHPLDVKKGVRTELEGDDLIRPDEFRQLTLGQAIILSLESFPIVAEFPLLDNLHIPNVGRHRATDSLFNEVRKYLPKPPRTPKHLSRWMAPYLFNPRIDEVLTTPSAPPLSPATASEPPASLKRPLPNHNKDTTSSTTQSKTHDKATASATANTVGGESSGRTTPPHSPAGENDRPIPHPAPADPAETLNEWVRSLDGAPVACRLFIGSALDPEAARIASLREHPIPLPDDELLLALLEAHYVKRLSDTQIEITRAGYKKLGQAEKNVLSRLAMLTVLIGWIEENGSRIIGHSAYVVDDSHGPKGQLTEDGHLIILRTALSNEVLKGAAPTPDYLSKLGVNPDEDVRLTIRNSRRRAYRIPLPAGLYRPTKGAKTETKS